MKRCSPEERELCARHEATHVLFTVVLDGSVRRVGIPRTNGNPPHNPMRRGRKNSLMGYVDCTHNNSGLEGFICLVGHSFEKAYGDPDRALWDYQDAQRLIATDSFAEAEKLADALVGRLKDNINAVANQLMAKARKDGKIEYCKLKKIIPIIEDKLGEELYKIRKQIKRCCETQW